MSETSRLYSCLLLVSGLLLTALPTHAQHFDRDSDEGAAPFWGRAKALAAPTNLNALELDGEMKSFFKVGGFRDGVQKAIFDETQDAPASHDFDDQPEKGFNKAYDDNSIVDSRNETPLWIPPLYRNETDEEKSATATSPEPPTSTVSRKLRPLVATGLDNRVPIPVRTTPRPIIQPVQPFGRQQPVVEQPQQQFQVQQTFQKPFVSQQTVLQPAPQQPQQFVPQQPQPQQPQQFVPQQFVPQQPQPQQPQQFVPQQFVPQQFVPQQLQPQQFVPQQPQQLRTFVPQQQQQTLPPQQLVPQQPVQRPTNNRLEPVLSTNFPTLPQQQHFRRPFIPQQPPRRPSQLRPAGQQQSLQPQSPRPLRPFQPQQNNFSNQPPRNSTALRTGVCPNTIFYQTVLASAFELQQIYSHFAVVVSVDQCARTCHEFNCAAAFLDPQTRHCQFNPSTSFTMPEGICPQWPNPLYRNNIVIGPRAYKISCVTCQSRRRNNRPTQSQQQLSSIVANRFFNGQQPQQPRNQFNNRLTAPFVFQTTNHNRLSNNFRQRMFNIAAHGVPIQQQQKTIIVDDHYGREHSELSEADWKSLEELESNEHRATGPRTTILPPLLSSLRIQPLKQKGLVYSPEEPVKEPTAELDSTINFRLRDQVEEEGSAPLQPSKPAFRNTKGVTTNKEGSESRMLVEIPTS